jgi:hypothetical protein
MPSCDQNAYQFVLASEQMADTLYIVLSFAGDDGDQCHTSERFIVSITDANGGLLAIDGNGATYAVGVPYPGPAESWFAWINWCGELGAFQVDVDGRGGGALQAIEPPPCTNPDAPSTLTTAQPIKSEPAEATPTE